MNNYRYATLLVSVQLIRSGLARLEMRYKRESISADVVFNEQEVRDFLELIRSATFNPWELEEFSSRFLQELLNAQGECVISRPLTFFGYCLGCAMALNRKLLIQVRYDGSFLSNLPLEYLRNVGIAGECLGTSENIRLVRSSRKRVHCRRRMLNFPLTGLIVVGPADNLKVEDEIKDLESIAQDSNGLIVWKVLKSPTIAELHRFMESHKADIFHYIGHGPSGKSSPHGSRRCIEGGLTAEALEFLVATLEPQLVFLNGCVTALPHISDGVHNIADMLVTKGVPLVIGMQHEISDHSALMFSRCFYKAFLLSTLPGDVAASANVARRSIKNFVEASSVAEGREDRVPLDYGAPVLYMADGRPYLDLRNEKTIKSPPWGLLPGQSYYDVHMIGV